jgi:hypothetical protein
VSGELGFKIRQIRSYRVRKPLPSCYFYGVSNAIPAPVVERRLFFREADKSRGAGTDLSASERPRRDGEGDIHLVCVQCRNIVTEPAARTEVQGSHKHTFANPHGFVFHIACFSPAPGVRPAGAPSLAFPWFTGFTWQVDLCAQCGIHLGWFFQSSDRSFHGLITDRLVEEEAGQPPEHP